MVRRSQQSDRGDRELELGFGSVVSLDSRWRLLNRDGTFNVHRELVDLIFEQPYCRIANVVEAGIVERQAASRYLKSLDSIGVLRERKVGREKLFTHARLPALLTSETHEFEPYH